MLPYGLLLEESIHVRLEVEHTPVLPGAVHMVLFLYVLYCLHIVFGTDEGLSCHVNTVYVCDFFSWPAQTVFEQVSLLWCTW